MFVQLLRKGYKANMHQIVLHRGESGMKFSKIVNQDVYVENEKIGRVKDVYVDC